MSCHKKRMTIHEITLWRIHVTPLIMSVSAKCFPIGIVLILKAIKSQFKGSYDKQNLTLVVISCEFMKLVKGLVHKFHMK